MTTFCKTVWSGVHILPSGDIRLCSINNDDSSELGVGRDAKGKVINIMTHSLQEALNSDKHCRVRKKNLDSPDAWDSMCRCCELKEVATNNSKEQETFRSRRNYLEEIVDSSVDSNNYSSAANADGTVNSWPTSLDLRFGNLCNQACIQCGPFYSNKWYEDREAYDKTFKNISKYTTGFGPSIVEMSRTETGKIKIDNEVRWWETETWWEKYEEALLYVTHIYLTGGEPMVVSGHERLLDTAIEMGVAHKIYLEYDSNCTAINPRLFDKWRKFRKVEIRASMDAIEDQYELIRYGGSWDVFRKNLITLKQISAETNGRVGLGAVSACYQMSTLFNIMDSERWVLDNGFKFHIRYIDTPHYHSIDYLSVDARDELMKYFSQFPDSVVANTTIRYLRTVGKKWNNLHIPQYVQFMDFMDGRRNTDWKTTLKDVHEFCDRHQTKKIINITKVN